MKFFQKRAVAAVVLILAIVAGVVIGQAKKPDTGGQASTAIVGSYTYVYDYAGVLTDETMEHIDAMNASLFAQTGAQIDLLAVLVRAGEEHDVLAPQAVIPGQRVRGHRTVGVADVELVRGIVDGRCDIEFFLFHGILSFKTAAPNGRAPVFA